MKNIQANDPEIYDAISGEIDRQNTGLEMIASENFVSKAVLEAIGSVFTNKYAEGYPAKRYYGGCVHADTVENLARERGKELFGAEHVNVQPHSGSQANISAFTSLLKTKQKILGMNLAHGGHLTHGSPVNFSGNLFEIVAYGVQKDTGRIDYDNVRDIARRERPALILAGFSAYPRQLDFKVFREIADEVDAYLMADIAHIAGLIAAKEHPDPIPYCHISTTTTHKTLRGPRGGMIILGPDALNKYPDPWSGKQRKLKSLVDSRVFPGNQGGPLVHCIAAKAVAFKEALKPEYKTYIKQVIKNASVLGEAMVEKGFNLVSEGTDNHLILVDLTSKGVTGKDAEERLEEAGITVNKNMVPFDSEKPTVTSGVRIGTPALTTRGMKEEEMRYIAGLIDKVVVNISNDSVIKDVRAEIKDLCKKFPLYDFS